MFFGYCFDEQGYHTPADAYRYCLRLHHEWNEIRITDEDDYCVMHVVVPFPDGKFRYIDLTDPRVAYVIRNS